MTDHQNARRRPVFLRPPANWDEMTEEDKDAWSLQFLDAAIAAAAPEDGPKFEEQNASGVGQA